MCSAVANPAQIAREGAQKCVCDSHSHRGMAVGAGNGLAGPARHHFLPPQLAKALAPAAAP